MLNDNEILDTLYCAQDIVGTHCHSHSVSPLNMTSHFVIAFFTCFSPKLASLSVHLSLYLSAATLYR
jgi:hypothetical protein